MTERDHQIFASELRRLRVNAGFETGKEFASAIGWVASKVSRIEKARIIPADSDLDDWLPAVGADDETEARLRSALVDLRLARDRWKQQLRRGHSERQHVEAVAERDASFIASVELFLVPGLVQTPGYARHVFEMAAEMHETPTDSDDAVRERIQRQDVLYDPSKRIEILIGESALRYPICDVPMLRVQIDRLLNLVGLAHVRFGVIPLGTTLPTITMHGYTIHDDTVLVEVNHTEITVTETADVALYRDITERLWTIAAAGDDARDLLQRILRAL
ncbi:helix-turn-helix domain-containing protein [Amycolatopsis circi]|uniref:helix-turn-helix domain-containing protein n=1 Tax=Amycolatopsis circi TaxID=871959 RepID=UPI0013BE8B20|nr:helix-turn-helix transcriptional regulator [Amycolatopsis circi]